MTSTAARRDTAPVHPGEILKEEFLEDYGLSQYELAKRIGVPAPHINAIVSGKRGISAGTALLLARFFGNSPEFWLNLQDLYDLQLAEGRLAGKLERVVGLTAEERAR